MKLKREHCAKAKRCRKKACEDDCKLYVDTMVRTKRERTQHMVQLTDGEKLRVLADLAEAQQDLELFESEAADIAAQRKAKKTAILERIKRLSMVGGAGKELRDVTVDVVTDYRNNSVTTVLADDGRELSTRELNTEERQTHMAFMEAVKNSREAAEAKAKEEKAAAKGEAGKPEEGAKAEPVKPTDQDLAQAWEVIKAKQSAKTSVVQRGLHCGTPKAMAILEALQSKGMVSEPKEGGVREILVDA